LSASLEKGTSLSRDAWLRLRKNRLAVASMIVLIAMFALCFIAVRFCQNPNEQNLTNQFAAPSAEHWLGTDQLGRDLLSRVLYGGQVSLLVGIVATAVALTIGIVYGSISGYSGSRVDDLMMRIVDTLYAIPFLVLVILLKVVISGLMDRLGARAINDWGWDADFVGRFGNIVPLFLAIGALGWLTLARITRAQVQDIRRREFVEAAVSLGLSPLRVLFRHIVPNTLGTAIVYTTLTMPGFIMFEATLSYLGLGIEAPNSSWGILIKEGANYMETHLRLLVVPALFFSITLFALNFLGDGLRDALDPKTSKD
jgi:oligopeptide transport system permease protein